MITVKVGQRWKETVRGTIVRVAAVITHDPESVFAINPYALVENCKTGRTSRISLKHFCPHHHWRIYSDVKRKPVPSESESDPLYTGAPAHDPDKP